MIRPLVIVALLLVLPLGFMYQTLLMERPMARDDAAGMVYPMAKAMGESLQRGDLYLWDDSQWCGLPVLATGQSTALYPPHLLLFALLPWMAALHLSYWLHLALMGLAVAWVARNLRLSWGGALLAATVYCGSGYVAAHLIHFNVILAAAHLPLMLAVLQTALARNRWGWWALLALEGACAFVCAHPQVFIMALVVCGLWLIVGHRGRESGRYPVAGLMAAAVAALLLVMPQLLPELELAALSDRATAGAGAAAYLGSYPFAARDLARVLLPSIFGTVHENTLGGGPSYHESCAFVGAGPLLLAIVGLVVARGRAGYGFAIAVLVIGAALMPGEGNPLHALLARLPFFGGFRAMGRWALLPILSVSLLAGMALTWLPETPERRRDLAAKVTTVLVSIIGLAVVALWYTFAVDEAGKMVMPGQPHLAVPIKVPADAVFNCMVGWEPVLLLVAAAVVAALMGRAAKVGRFGVAATVLAAIVVAAPLWHHWQITNLTVPRTYYTEPPHTAQVARGGRITTLPPDMADPEGRAEQRAGHRDDRPDLGERELLNPALATVFGIPYADGYKQGLVTPSTLKMWESYRHYGTQAFSGVYTVSPDSVTRYGTPAERMKRMHELCAVQYIVTTGEINDPDLRVMSEGRVRVYLYPPRRDCWLATRAITIADPEAQLDVVKWREFDPHRDVVVDRECALPDQARPGTAWCGWEGESPEWRPLAVHTNSPDGGVAVLADAWYPGWEATLDGERVPIMRANGAFRGVLVPAGEHTIEFRFRPKPWRIGLILMCVGLAMVIAMVAADVRRAGGAP